MKAAINYTANALILFGTVFATLCAIPGFLLVQAGVFMTMKR